METLRCVAWSEEPLVRRVFAQCPVFQSWEGLQVSSVVLSEELLVCSFIPRPLYVPVCEGKIQQMVCRGVWNHGNLEHLTFLGRTSSFLWQKILCSMLKVWISSPCAKENRVFGFIAPGALVNPWPAIPLGTFPVSPERDLCERCQQRVSSSLYHRQSVLYLPKNIEEVWKKSCSEGLKVRTR